MDIVQINTKNRKQVKQFLNFPYRLYKDVPQWVPPLSSDAQMLLNEKKNPFYQQGKAAFFLAQSHQRTVGRLAVLNNHRFNQYNQQNCAFFYLFESENDQNMVEELFEAGIRWVRSQQLDMLIGPRGFNVFDGIGMLVKGFEYRPAFGLPYNLPYYPELLENIGFTVKGETISGYLDGKMIFPEKVHQVAELLKKRRGLHVAQFKSKRDLKAMIPHLKNLYNQALQGTPDNVPISDFEVDLFAKQMLWFADINLIKIVMKGEEPVGFLFAYPDISAAVQKTKGKVLPFGWIQLLLELRKTNWININGAGMIEGYRGLGGTALLFSEMYKSVAQSRYRFADIVQVGAENDKMLREMRDFGINLYKVHRVYQRSIN